MSEQILCKLAHICVHKFKYDSLIMDVICSQELVISSFSQLDIRSNTGFCHLGLELS